MHNFLRPSDPKLTHSIPRRPLFEQNAQIIALAARHAVPTIYTYGEIVRAGGLISYGSILSDAFRFN
jgi:hypothetical protein